MSRSSDRRAQTEPLAALAAVFVLGSALTVYAVGLESALPTAENRDRDLAAPALERVSDRVLAGGVADPGALTANGTLRRSGYDVNVTLRTPNRTWQAGPAVPPGAKADAATRRVAIRRWPGEVVTGTLRVEVWS